MTDGIIQKAFKPYLYRKTRRIEFEELQKRLIAEIEKKFANKNVGKFTCSIFSLVELRKILIGNGEKK